MHDESISIYLRGIRELPLLTKEREYELSCIKNDPESTPEKVDAAVNELILHNLRFVILLAKRRMKGYEDLAEMICDGNEGLVTAAKHFDASKGQDGKGRFTTYAMWWINRHIRDGLRKRSSKVVTIPRNQWDDAQKIRMEKGSSLSHSRARRAKDVVSIQVESMDDENSAVFDIPDPNTPNPFSETENTDLMRLACLAIDGLGLDDDERALLSKYGDEGATHVKYMAKKRGVTTSRIRMLKKEIVWKLKRRILATVGEDEYIRLSGEKLSPCWRKQKKKTKKTRKSRDHQAVLKPKTEPGMG